MYKWGARTQRRHRHPGKLPRCGPESQVFLSSMAKRPLLLLLTVWVLAGELWLRAETRASPFGVKLCGREFIRAVIFTCGGSRWRRADVLAPEATGEAGEAAWGGEGWTVDGTWDGPKSQGQGRRVPVLLHATGETCPGLKAGPRWEEPVSRAGMGVASHPHPLVFEELATVSGAPAECEPALSQAAACTTPTMGGGAGGGTGTPFRNRHRSRFQALRKVVGSTRPDFAT